MSPRYEREVGGDNWRFERRFSGWRGCGWFIAGGGLIHCPEGVDFADIVNHRIQFPLHIHFPFGAQGEAAHTFVETDVGKDRLEVTEAARQYLAEVGYDPHFGAHPLKRAIQRELQDPLALKVLAGEFREGDTIRLDTCGASLETCATGLTFSVGVEVVEGEVVA